MISVISIILIPKSPSPINKMLGLFVLYVIENVILVLMKAIIFGFIISEISNTLIPYWPSDTKSVLEFLES